MSVDQMVAVFAASVSFVGLLLVAIQMRGATKQRNLESLYQVYDVNRQLLSLGFSHPQLFDILADEENVDPKSERRYLQMWLNQLSLVHTYLKNGGFDAEFHDGLERDIADFLTARNVQRYWKLHGDFYPASFQTLVNGILSEMEAPKVVPSDS